MKIPEQRISEQNLVTQINKTEIKRYSNDGKTLAKHP